MLSARPPTKPSPLARALQRAGLARVLGPERLAAVLSLAVVVTLTALFLASSALPRIVIGGEASPTASVLDAVGTPRPAKPSPTPKPAQLTLIGAEMKQIDTSVAELNAELGTANPGAFTLAASLRAIASSARQLGDAAQSLGQTHPSRDAKRLVERVQDLRDHVSDVLAQPLGSTKSYTTGSRAVIREIAGIHAVLVALQGDK